MVDALESACATHEAFEEDAGSSSPSDYSDSETESTTDMDESEGEEGSEEDGSDDDAKRAPPPRQRR